jgi:tetratricopeptide (TPR) repeat protein
MVLAVILFSCSESVTEKLDKKNLINSHIQLANSSLSGDKLIDVVNHLNMAHSLCREVDDYNFIYKSYLQIGTTYEKLGTYDLSESYYFEMLDLVTKYNDSTLIMDANNMLGCLYYKQFKYEKSEPYLIEALSLARDLNNRKMIAGAISNLGMIDVVNEKYQLAISKFNEALEINKQLGNNSWEAINYHNLGAAHKKVNNMPRAEYYFLEGYRLDSIENDHYAMCSDLISISSFYIDMKQYKKGMGKLEMSVEMCKKHGYFNLLLRAYSQLSSYYEDIDDYKNAYRYQVLANKQKSDLEVQKENAQYHSIKIRDMFHEIKYEKEKQKTRNLFTTIIVALISLVVVLSLILMYLKQKNQLRLTDLQNIQIKHELAIERENSLQNQLEKKKLEDSLEKERIEIITKELHISEKNQLLEQLAESLEKLKEFTREEGYLKLQTTLNDINHEKKSNIWGEFELRFQDLHSDFYMILNDKYPDLTANERKLCAFLRLNLSTKDISAITHQSPKTINVARTRLRKKLGLTNTDSNIHEFLVKLNA